METREIQIGNRWIGPSHPPFIVAEMSGNHNRSLERALEIVEVASASGAHALKLQTYTPDTMTLDERSRDFRIDDEKSLWKGKTLYELYGDANTPWEWHRPILDRCRKLGLLCFSTPFDESSVDFLDTLGVPCYKIASFENADLPLLRKVSSKGKPVIVSTGMATLAELDEMVRTVRNAGCRDLVLLKCTSSYPASPAASNLRSIPLLKEMFGVQVGLSDHTLGIGVALAGIALGASIVEKHFTLRRTDGGVDAAFSIEPEELRLLVAESERAWLALGRTEIGPTDEEQGALHFRRSLYISQDMREGEALSRENLRAIRPGFGLSPKYLDIVLGMHVRRYVKRGTPLSWDLLR